MLDRALKGKKLYIRLTIKGALCLLFCVLAVALPQIAHAVGGAAAGTKYMPMYLPVLLAGCVLGWQWGLITGLLSPIFSYGFTILAFGNAMPALSRLPQMVAELSINGLITGLWANKIAKSPVFAFPAVISAQLSGRAVYVLSNLISGRAFGDLLISMTESLPGLYIQAALAPLLVIIFALAVKYEQKT